MRGHYVLGGKSHSFKPGEQIIFEDNHLLIVNKPVGLLSQGDQTGDPSLVSVYREFIKVRDAKPGNVWLSPINRLDRTVGGLVIMAKTSKAASRLAEQVRQKNIRKFYLAVCHGLSEKQGKLVDKLSRKKRAGRYEVVANGRIAELEYRRLAYIEDQKLSLIEINLITGRPHQIRLQMAHHKWPLLGDHRYGEAEDEFRSPALFAYKIGFKHPVKNESVCISLKPKGSGPFELFCPEISDLL